MHGVVRIVDRVRDLDFAESEILSGSRKLFGEIAIPVDATGPVGRKIGFAHRWQRCCHLDNAVAPNRSRLLRDLACELSREIAGVFPLQFWLLLILARQAFTATFGVAIAFGRLTIV